MPRTGYNKDFYFFAQWFPKVGVYEPKGMRYAQENQWNCHQYHSSGEYYSDFGNYEVNITVPEDFVVAASGELAGQSKQGNLKTWHFKAFDVIDYTWTCSPHFVVNEDRYKNTVIKYYSYAYKDHLKSRYFNTIKYCMEYLDKHIAEYPYSTLSIIDPPIHGMFTGGMEYPTLITSLSFCFFPEGIKTPETLVVHEFIHQYFMQMVATHEVEEAWMDEGITSYYESRILDSFMGNQTSTIDFCGFKVGNKEFNRVEFFGTGNPKIASNAIKSWEYTNGGYGEIAYNKVALWLQTLEGLIGLETMDLVMKTYFERWKFRHPARQDFIDVVNDVVREQLPGRFPDGMDWYFDQVLYGTDVCDYSVASIKNDVIEGERGFFDDLSQCESVENVNSNFKSKVIFYRLGGIQLPVEIKLNFENGQTKHYEWDGLDRSFDIIVETDSKVVSAHLDPDRKIYMDKNFINNSLSVEAQSSALNTIWTNVFIKVQHLIECISFII
jgi:hypothetical protein